MAEEKEKAPGREGYKQRLSPGYFRALDDATKYHSSTDKFSGKFLRPHAKHIKTIIQQYDIKSILDYGCGKGLQYTWVIPNANIEQWGDGAELERGSDLVPHGKTLEEYWGINVTKFDPAFPAFAEEPRKAHDLVIVSHVLGAIPVIDLPVIIERIFSLTNKYTFIVEAIGRPKKRWLTDDEIDTPRFYAVDWIDALAPLKPAHVRCELCVRYRSTHGTHLGRFRI